MEQGGDQHHVLPGVGGVQLKEHVGGEALLSFLFQFLASKMKLHEHLYTSFVSSYFSWVNAHLNGMLSV